MRASPLMRSRWRARTVCVNERWHHRHTDTPDCRARWHAPAWRKRVGFHRQAASAVSRELEVARWHSMIAVAGSVASPALFRRRGLTRVPRRPVAVAPVVACGVAGGAQSMGNRGAGGGRYCAVGLPLWLRHEKLFKQNYVCATSIPMNPYHHHGNVGERSTMPPLNGVPVRKGAGMERQDRHGVRRR